MKKIIEWKRQLHYGDKIKIKIKTDLGTIKTKGVILSISYLKDNLTHILFKDGSNLTVKLTNIY